MSIIKYQFQHPSIFKLLALKYQTTYNSIMTIHTYMFPYYIAINLTYIAINMYISLIQVITLYIDKQPLKCESFYNSQIF